MQAAVTNLRTPTPLIIQQKPKIFLCKKIDLVESPQPIYNPNQQLNQKPLFLQKVLEDDVAG